LRDACGIDPSSRSAVTNDPVPHTFDITAEPLDGPVAGALIAALNAELAAAYPEPGATHFTLDPAEVAPGAGAFVVARRDGRPVGCGALRALRDPALVRELGPHVGELKRMYVARDVRGQGVARALLARLEAEARSLGLTRVVLETGTRQGAALVLYRRADYVDIPAYGEYTASPSTSVCLAKAIAPAPPMARLLETALYVSDLARARAFYAGVLGAVTLLDTPRLVALDVAGQSVLLLFQHGATGEPMPTPGGVVPPHGAEGVQHLAFAVAADALDAWRGHLAAAGVALESEVRWPRGGTSLYLRDPDGHSVELVTPGLWATY
jgi:catechol 2,3-dioxygenase-like lactoylglutathione lyase family enzyme/GNAT superfamily N-acetyltransferase